MPSRAGEKGSFPQPSVTPLRTPSSSPLLQIAALVSAFSSQKGSTLSSLPEKT